MIYLHADLTLKEKALDSLAGPADRPDATDPPTPCWPSSTTSVPADDHSRIYAACAAPRPRLTSTITHPRGITRQSA